MTAVKAVKGDILHLGTWTHRVVYCIRTEGVHFQARSRKDNRSQKEALRGTPEAFHTHMYIHIQNYVYILFHLFIRRYTHTLTLCTFTSYICLFIYLFRDIHIH